MHVKYFYDQIFIKECALCGGWSQCLHPKRPCYRPTTAPRPTTTPGSPPMQYTAIFLWLYRLIGAFAFCCLDGRIPLVCIYPIFQDASFKVYESEQTWSETLKTFFSRWGSNIKYFWCTVFSITSPVRNQYLKNIDEDLNCKFHMYLLVFFWWNLLSALG